MDETNLLKMQLAAALAEIEVLKLQVSNANYLYKAELTQSGKLHKPTETVAGGKKARPLTR